MRDEYGYPYGMQGGMGYNPVYPQRGQTDPFSGINYQPYISFRQETPLDVIGQTANAMQKRYDDNVTKMDQLDMIMANLDFSEGDQWIKNNIAGKYRDQINEIAQQEDFENAMPRLRQAAKNLANDDVLKASQQNYAKMQADQSAAADLRQKGYDVLDFNTEPFSSYDPETQQINTYRSGIEQKYEWQDEQYKAWKDVLKETTNTTGINQDPNNPNYDYYENIRGIDETQIKAKAASVYKNYMTTKEGQQQLRAMNAGLEPVPKGLTPAEAIYKEIEAEGMVQAGITDHLGQYRQNPGVAAAKKAANAKDDGTTIGFETIATGLAGEQSDGVVFNNAEEVRDYGQTAQFAAQEAGDAPRTIKNYYRDLTYEAVVEKSPELLTQANAQIDAYNAMLSSDQYSALAIKQGSKPLEHVTDIKPETLKSVNDQMMQTFIPKGPENADGTDYSSYDLDYFTASGNTVFGQIVYGLQDVNVGVDNMLDSTYAEIAKDIEENPEDYGAEWQFFRTSNLTENGRSAYNWKVQITNEAFARAAKDETSMIFEEGPKGNDDDGGNRDKFNQASRYEVAGWADAESIEGTSELPTKFRIRAVYTQQNVDVNEEFFVVSFTNEASRDNILRQIKDPELINRTNNRDIKIVPGLTHYKKGDETIEISNDLTYTAAVDGGIPYNHFVKDGKPYTYSDWLNDSKSGEKSVLQNQAIEDIFTYNPELLAKFNAAEANGEAVSFLYGLLDKPIMITSKQDFLTYQK